MNTRRTDPYESRARELALAAGVDGEACAVADASRIERTDRSTEVAGVIAASQVLRQVGVEVDDDLVTNLTQVDMSMRVGQADQDAAGSVGAAAEVDAADGALAGRSHGGAAGYSR